MQKTITILPELKLVGITARTSNAREMNQDTAKIGRTMQKFFGSAMQERITERKNPGTTFCVYTNYESDASGDYTYFIGEEVTSFNDIDQEFETLIIDVQTYVKFTNQPGPMPAVCIDMWQNIWKMDESDLGAGRAYIADFEVYDQRSSDLSNAILDIYIGIKK